MRALLSCSQARVRLILVSLLLPTVAFSQAQFALPSAQKPISAASPRPLITQAIDEAQLTVLRGNTHPLARPQFDLGTAPATLPMERMLLVLKRSPEQESALQKLLDDQQDKSSPNYHKWLTPEDFGKQFGPADSDLQAVTTWLQSHGFQVGSTKGRTVLEFSGSASQVQEAFHTTIHKYIVNTEQHWANANDPSLPTSLTPAVAGVLTLHNFLKKPQIELAAQPAAAKIVPGKKPQVTFPAQNGQPVTNALGPQDYAVIYSINPTYNNNINGSGVTIGVVGRSNLYGGLPSSTPGQDVQDFRGYAFGLCCGPFNIVLNGPDPGDLGGGDEAEATLDSTWSGAIAYGANVDLVVSATTNTTDGVDLSEVYIVENNLADIMTESFSSCELYATDAQLSFTYALAQQAAAQGITYFVSTGDNGAEGCDDPSFPPATHPISINLLASTPFNVAVGGTMFNEAGQTTKYWGVELPVQESAISYIPENVWNESTPNASLAAGSGGASTGNIQGGLGGTTPPIPKPSWQSGVTGIPNDLVRDLPDVSLTAALHDPYLFCLEGSCFPNSQGEFFIYFAAGTSASAPSFAGIMALVDQQMANLNPGQGPRQGQANYVLYRLAASQNATLSQCNASNPTTLPASTCIFNDVTTGNNAVPGELNYGLSTADYQAGVGYDLATGLGSVNVTNLVNQWNSITFFSTMTTLSIPQSTLMHGAPVNFTVAVSPTSGTATPTGAVSLLAALNNDVAVFNHRVDNFTLGVGGTIASSTSNLPGGVYLLEAYYSGDATYAPSTSSWTTVDVNPEPSTTAVSALTFTANGTQLNFTSGPFGSFVYLRADVAGLSGHGTPTGGVTFADAFADAFGSIPGGSIFQLNAGDQLNNGSNTATPNGVTFDTGTHTISASYSGDASFNASSTTQSQSFTITPGFFAFVPPYAVNPVVIPAPGSSGQTAVNVSYSTGFTGTITLACSQLPAGATCQFAQASITGTGTLTTTTDTITVTTKTATVGKGQPPPGSHQPTWLVLAVSLFSGVLVIAPRRHRSLPLFLATLAFIILVPGCGGGGSSQSSSRSTSNPGTPIGTYNVLVTASSGSVNSTSGFTLIVQ